ncbi:MAG: carotenoid biosynthesis protein [Bacillota bacterium]
MITRRLHLAPAAAGITVLGVWMMIGLFFLRVPGAPTLPFDWGGAATLIAAAALSAHSLYRSDRRFIWPMLWILAVTAITETAGIMTGLPFGHYHYLAAAGPLLPGGLPAAIPAAWLALMLAAHTLLLGGRFPAWLQTIGVAAVMTGMDLAVDPIAVHRLSMWTWPDGGPFYGIPLQNFTGWFLVALVAAYPLSRSGIAASPAGLPTAVGALLMLFFCIAGAGSDLLLPSGIALGFAILLALHAVRNGVDHPWVTFRT